jgi:hypothetical protein
MQDYLIVRGYIDPIEHDTTLATYKPDVWTKLDRVARAMIQMHPSKSVCYMIQSCTTSKELWKTHLRKEGGRYENLSYSSPLQLTDERIRFDHGSPKRIRSNYFPAVSTSNDDRRRAKSSIVDEQSSTVLGNLHHDRMQGVGYGRKVLLKQQAPFFRKTLGGKRSFKTRQVKPTPYRVRVIDNNIVKEVPRAGRRRRETEASLGDR